MNPYQIVLIAFAVALLCGAVGGTAYLADNHGKIRARHAQRNMERAKVNARWEDVITTSHGKTEVRIRKVGSYGRRPEQRLVVEDHLMGSVREGDANASQKIEELRLEAQVRCSQLNVTGSSG